METMTDPLTDRMIEELLAFARQARERAYVPYSHFAVGAALLGRSSRVYTGCNVENASYPLTICAERVALAKAVSEGEREFEAIAVVTETGAMPCGACRQVLREFGGTEGNLRVIVAGLGDTSSQKRKRGSAAGGVRVFTIAELLPESFVPDQLGSAEEPSPQ